MRSIVITGKNLQNRNVRKWNENCFRFYEKETFLFLLLLFVIRLGTSFYHTDSIILTVLFDKCSVFHFDKFLYFIFSTTFSLKTY